jgi:broad specificity phosphatase PhoE
MTKSKTMIYIVRHGETDWNLQEKMMGVSDIPLNTRGIKQAEDIARDLKDIHFDSIYSSPLSRTMKTATIINTYHNLPIITTADLREREFGELEGVHYKEIQAYHAGLMFSQTWNYPDYRPPGGESANDVNRRVQKFIKKILQKDKGKLILLVSHGVTIRILIAALLGNPPKYLNDIRFKNASLALVEIRGDKAPTLHIANYLPARQL